jgi:hypothetical protein
MALRQEGIFCLSTLNCGQLEAARSVPRYGSFWMRRRTVHDKINVMKRWLFFICVALAFRSSDSLAFGRAAVSDAALSKAFSGLDASHIKTDLFRVVEGRGHRAGMALF